MDELLAELEKTAPDLAKKLRAAHAAEVDTHKGAAITAEKKAAAAQRAADKLTADAAASGKTVEESTAAARKERDEAKAAAATAAAELQAHRVRVALERKLAIADETKSRRAVAALNEHAPDGFELDEHGKLVGADKAIEAFKAAEPFWFEPESAPVVQIGQRPGSGPGAAKPAGSSGTKTPQTRTEKIEAHKARMTAGQKKKTA